MSLADLRIDEALWQRASGERRNEWRQAVADLLEEHRLEAPGRPGPLHLQIGIERGTTWIAASVTLGGAGAEALPRIELPMAALAPHFQEYFGIVKDMGKLGESIHSPRIEALDIAKRIAHDEAAETLQKLLAPLGADHPTCRRFFTLLVTLHFDTTRLLLPHHRAPRAD